MKKKQEFLDLLTSVDVLNTIHGGTSEPQVALQQNEIGREIHVKIPGVNNEDVRIEVHNNVLSIFYFIPVISNDKLIQMPCLIYNRNIPTYIDAQKIGAHQEGPELVVELPYNDSATGFHRSIDLDNEE